VDRPILRYAILVLSAAVIQYAVFTQFRLLGVSLDLLLVLAVAAGMRGGPERGAVVGFTCGLALDAMSVTPFGLGAVSYLVAGTIAGLLEGATVHSSRWLTSAIAMVSSVAGIVMFAVLGSVLGQPGMLGGHLLTIVTIVAVGSAVLVFPVLRTCRWADPEDERLRSAAR
jgi:rod shape-determining protein MreD